MPHHILVNILGRIHDVSCSPHITSNRCLTTQWSFTVTPTYIPLPSAQGLFAYCVCCIFIYI